MEPALSQARAPSTSARDPESPKELPGPVKKFYKGEPLALGITQILIGIIGMAFGVLLTITDDHIYYVNYLSGKMPIWTGVLYIISGSLSVAASRNPKASLVKGMLGMNVVSAVISGFGILFLCVAVDGFGPMTAMDGCTDYNTSELNLLCYETIVIPYNIGTGVLAIMLLFTILEFCISISSAAFGCKTICRDSYTETVVVVYQNTSPSNAVGLPVVCQGTPPDNVVSLPDAKNL